MKTNKAKTKPASSAGAVSAAGGQKKTRLEQSGKRTRVRAHLRAATAAELECVSSSLSLFWPTEIVAAEI
jgi:hypothetical protein